VEFDAPVVQKQAKAGPTGQGITDRFGQGAPRWNGVDLLSEPELHSLHQGNRFGLPRTLPALGRLPTDGGLDRIKTGDALERLGRHGRAGGLVDLVELAPCMGPARRQLDFAASAETFKPWITVDLND